MFIKSVLLHKPCCISLVVLSPKHNILSGDEDGIIMASLGKIEEFYSKNTNVNHYLERLEQYFVANEVEADSSTSHRRRAILISVIGGKTYDILADLYSPASPSTKTYAELTTILKKQFALKKLVISERYCFYTFVQAENSSVSELAAQLQRLATTCNFGTHLMEALRDSFVCGLRSKVIQKRLLTEDVNFEKAVQIAQGLEVAENDVAQLSRHGSSSNSVLKLHNASGDRKYRSHKSPQKGNVKRPQDKGQPSSSNQRKFICLRCGKQGHLRSNCKYRNYTCYKCGKEGHISEACKGKTTRVNAVKASPECEDLTDPFSISLYTVSSGQHGIEVPIELNGHSVLMELDTGAGVSIISEDTYRTFSRMYPLSLVP